MDKTRRLGKRHDGPKVDHKVFVATPAYDGKVDTDYAMCLAETSMHAQWLKIGVQAQVMGNGAFIEMARNIFAHTFLTQTDASHLFYIDSDLKWESRAFIGLVQSGRPVSAGVYRRRQEPEDYPVHYVEDTANPGIRIDDGGWVECDRVPTGFLCIQRHVIEAMAEKAPKVFIPSHGEIPWLFHTKMVEIEGQTRFMGEDFGWSDDYVEQFDEPIWVWPDFDFVHGGFECNWHTFMNKQVARAEAGEVPAIDLIKASA